MWMRSCAVCKAILRKLRLCDLVVACAAGSVGALMKGADERLKRLWQR